MNNPTDPNEPDRNELFIALENERRARIEAEETADERVRTARMEADQRAIDIRYEIFMEQRKTIKKLANMPCRYTEFRFVPPPTGM